MKKRNSRIMAVINLLIYVKWGVENYEFDGENRRILISIIENIIDELEKC